MNNLNIALCSTGELYGGVEQFIYTISDYFNKDGRVNLTVILFNKGVLYKKLKKAKIETYVYLGHKYDFFLIKQLVKLFKEKKINIVHTHGYKANILCSLAAKFCKAKIVKTEHGKIEPSSSKYHFSYFRMKLNTYVDIAISKLFVDAIVFVSNDIKHHYDKFYRNIESAVIYNGIPKIEIYTKTILPDIDHDFFSIGIVGRLSNVKGHIYLLKALKLLSDLKDLRLYVFGDGALHIDLLSYCHQNKISDRVIFMGFRENIHYYLSALDLFVMPSLYEGLPYALLEAMYLKIPIIASNIGGLREIIENNVDALLVPPGNDERLAAAIRFLYQHPEVRKNLCEAAYKNVSNSFTIEKMAARYIEVYNRIFCDKKHFFNVFV